MKEQAKRWEDLTLAKRYEWGDRTPEAVAAHAEEVEDREYRRMAEAWED